MYKQNLALFITFVLFALFSDLKSQITVSPASTGCDGSYNPLFTAPAGATNIVWTIQNQGSVNTASAQTSFPVGTHGITLTCVINGSPQTFVTSVTTHPKPNASFSYQKPSSGCYPMTVNFTASGSPGLIYNWSFGDLSPLGSGPSVNHSYNFSNSFSPIMIVTNAATGCTNIATNNSAPVIHVSDKPIVNISSSAGTSTCLPPFKSTIDGSGSVSKSPTGGPLTYTWSGPGVAGNSPIGGSVNYTSPGQYIITLSVTDNNECINTGALLIKVNNPTLTATIDPTVCLGAAVDVNINTSEPLVHISGMGGGGSFTTAAGVNNLIPGAVIATPKGLNVVTFLVTSPGCPPVTVTKNVFVEDVVVTFTSLPPGSSCQPSMAITFVNTSSVNTSHALTYTWLAANGGNGFNQITPMTTLTTNQGNVTFTISQGSKNPYTIFNPPFNPVITLMAKSTSIAQCSMHLVLSSTHTLSRPTAFFVRDSMQGCVPLTVRFRDTSFYHPSFPVPTSNYTWCNGATSPSYSFATQTPTFTYSQAGTYYPYLIIETSNGCRDTSFYDTITVVPPPLITASFNSVACVHQPFLIHMSGTPAIVPSSSTITHWHAETDNGFFSGCVSDSMPIWFFTHPGIQTVTISGYQAGCKSTKTMTQTVNVSGPIAKFSHEYYCGAKNVVTFTLYLNDATGGTLSYGDGNQNVFTVNTATASVVFTHTYTQFGTYNVTLTPTATTGCVPKPFIRKVELKNPSVKMWHDGKPFPTWPEALACTKSPFLFTATYTDVVIGNRYGLSWNFITPTYTLAPVKCDHANFMFHMHGSLGVIADPIMRDTFRLAGNYTISVTGRDANGCEVTEKIKFRISNAIPSFTWASNPACFSDNPFQIINTTQSKQVYPDSIATYKWYFGDGQSQTSTNAHDNPINHYGSVAIPSQTFNVMAIATNTLGCTDTTIQKFQINNPDAKFIVNDPFPCIPLGQGRLVTFGAMQGYSTYSVNYGDSPSWQTSSGFNNAGHTYFQPGTYISTLTVIDAANCKSTQSATITALGQPTASMLFVPDNKLCVPEPVKIRSNSLTNITPIDNYSWGMKNILTPAGPKDTLDEILDKPGTYTVSLTVSIGQYGLCPSTATNIVYLYDTKGKIEIDKTTFCLGETIKVKAIDLQDVAKWQWFFGDLVPQNPIFNTQFAPNPIQYQYVNYPTAIGDGKAVIRLQLTSPGDGCTPSFTVPIQVIKLTGDFIKSDNIFAHCLGLTDVFIKTTPNPLNLDLYHLWDFGDGTNAVGDSVSTIYPAPGNYTVRLSVRDTVHNCSDTVFKNMVIFPNPTSQMFINDSLICPSDTFDITGNGSAGVISGTIASSEADYPVTFNSGNTFTMPMQVTKSDTFMLKVTDNNGCESPPVEQVIFVPDPAKEVHTSTTIVIGQTVNLNANAGAGYSYSWTPEILALSATGIPNPVSSTTTDISYTVQIVDEPLHCYVSRSIFSIHVLPLTTVDVPSAFTPNGDGVNDIVFPGGWGIRALNYFRIYNRWGQMIFESTDLAHGWDGTFEGTPQNTETYVYQVEVQTWVDSEPVLSKTGTIKLLR